MTDRKLEIYKQRYETFRHLDKLRWHMLQMALAIGAIVISFAQHDGGRFSHFSYVFCGVAMILLSVAMERIGSAIRANGEILSTCGASIGDNKIMSPKGRLSSSAFWIALTIGIFGSLLAVFGVTNALFDGNFIDAYSPGPNSSQGELGSN